MNTPKGLPTSLRTMAANLTSAAGELARVLNSVASALEPGADEDEAGDGAAATGPAPGTTATARATANARRAATGRQRAGARRSAAATPDAARERAGARRGAGARTPATARKSNPAARQALTRPRADSTSGTDGAVRAAMAELGPATATRIAAQVNQTAGRRAVDGRAIPGHARRLGARSVTRRGQRLYQL